MCGFCCIVSFAGKTPNAGKTAGKTLLDYTNLFSPNDHEKNDKIIHKYFKDKYDKP